MKKLDGIFKEGFETWINENLIPRPSPIFYEIEQKAKEINIPILSPASGAILKFLIETLKPKRILELGTGLGYSTSWMLASDLSLHIDTIDRNPLCLEESKKFIDKIKSSSQKVEYLKTHGLLYLRNLDSFEIYDFIFIDFDKITYPELLELLLKKTNPKVQIVFDNVLWHGRLDPQIHNRPSDLSIQKLWSMIKERNLKYTLFPSGDGLLFIQN